MGNNIFAINLRRTRTEIVSKGKNTPNTNDKTFV